MKTNYGDELFPVGEKLLYRFNNFPCYSTLTQLVDKYFVVHFVKRLGKVKVNDIVVIAIQKTLDDVVNVLEEMSEAAATFTKPVLLVAEYAVRLKVANKFLYEVGSKRDGMIVSRTRLITLFEDGSYTLNLHIFRNNLRFEGFFPYKKDRIRDVVLTFLEDKSRNVVVCRGCITVHIVNGRFLGLHYNHHDEVVVFQQLDC